MIPKMKLSLYLLTAGFLLLLANCQTIQWESAGEPIEWKLNEDKVSADLKPDAERQMEDFRWRLNLNREMVEHIQQQNDSPQTRELFQEYLEDKRTPPYCKWLVLQRLAGFEILNDKHLEAANIWDKNLQHLPEKYHERAQKIAALLRAEENGPAIRNLGSQINSSSSEYTPIPELSGDRIYFTAMSRPGGTGLEDVWMSRRKAEGYETIPLDDVNTTNHESPLGISADGTELTIFGNYPGSLGEGDIFVSRMGPDGWSSPKPLPAPINTPHFECDAKYTADGKALLFSSDRPESPFPKNKKDIYFAGNFWGNTDMYVSLRRDDGTWGDPINLGPQINTPGAERSPYLYADGKTLYFSSNGYDGLGGLDIYKSVRLDDTWQKWSTPVNIGRMVNGPGTDWGFIPAVVSDKGYFSAELPGTHGSTDLYEILPLPAAARPELSVVAVRGQVHDEAGNPLEAWIESSQNKSVVTQLKSKLDGSFFITMLAGKVYELHFSKEGYEDYVETVDFSQTNSYEEKVLDIKLRQPIKDRSITTISSTIYFAFNKAELTDKTRAELDQLASEVAKQPDILLEIQGHTDNLGSKKYNEKLSYKRALAARNYLMSKGLNAKRMRLNPLGETKPDASNKTREGRALNRRVIIIEDKK